MEGGGAVSERSRRASDVVRAASRVARNPYGTSRPELLRSACSRHPRRGAWLQRHVLQHLACDEQRCGAKRKEAGPEGRGAQQSDSDAVIWFRKAAEQGDPTAQCTLGIALM